MKVSWEKAFAFMQRMNSGYSEEWQDWVSGPNSRELREWAAKVKQLQEELLDFLREHPTLVERDLETIDDALDLKGDLEDALSDAKKDME